MFKYFFELIQHLVERIRIGKCKFIFISNNCFGSELYISTKRNYNTPFVGLILYPDCYIEFLSNFEENLEKNVKFIKKSKYFKNEPIYPIGQIDNEIEIHFIHYNSENEALLKWNRRMDRLKKDLKNDHPIFLKICDRDGCEEKHLRNFHQLPFKNKISLGIKPFDNKNHIAIPNLKDKNGIFLIDGLALFKKRYKYLDFSSWILKKEIKKTIISRFLSIIS